MKIHNGLNFKEKYMQNDTNKIEI